MRNSLLVDNGSFSNAVQAIPKDKYHIWWFFHNHLADFSALYTDSVHTDRTEKQSKSREKKRKAEKGREKWRRVEKNTEKLRKAQKR
jgi:hypothetical protein